MQQIDPIQRDTINTIHNHNRNETLCYIIGMGLHKVTIHYSNAIHSN